MGVLWSSGTAIDYRVWIAPNNAKLYRDEGLPNGLANIFFYPMGFYTYTYTYIHIIDMHIHIQNIHIHNIYIHLQLYNNIVMGTSFFPLGIMDRPRKRPPCGSRQDEIQGNMDTLTGQSTGPPPPPGEQVSSDVKIFWWWRFCCWCWMVVCNFEV